MENLFSPDQITSMSAEIDSRLAELQQGATALESSGGIAKGARNLDELFDLEFNTIGENTGKDSKEFLKAFCGNAKGELCEKEGMLYKQWDKWSDLTNPATIAAFGTVLAGMGFSGSVLPALVVAIGVIVLRLGVKSFCELYSK